MILGRIVISLDKYQRRKHGSLTRTYMGGCQLGCRDSADT